MGDVAREGRKTRKPRHGILIGLTVDTRLTARIA